MTETHDNDRALFSGALPPADAAVALLAGGDQTAAALCVTLASHEAHLASAGWDAAPSLWPVERLTATAGESELALARGLHLRCSSVGGLTSMLEAMAAQMAGQTELAPDGPDVIAWVLAAETWVTSYADPDCTVPLLSGARRMETRVLLAADRAGISYQLLHPHGRQQAMYVQQDGQTPVTRGSGGAALAALQALAAATPLPAPGG